MNDMAAAIKPKSDQLNADDLISGPKTITIRAVKVHATPEQPVWVYFEGDDNKPWKPCKSMMRLMVKVWGASSAGYVGKSCTLFLDPTVKWGGAQVGGIRISHMSHLDRELTVALTVTKGNKKPYTVKPLQATKQPDPKPAQTPPPATNSFDFDAYEFKVDQFLPHAETFEELDLFWRNMTADRKAAAGADQDRATKTREKVEARLKELKEV